MWTVFFLSIFDGTQIGEIMWENRDQKSTAGWLAGWLLVVENLIGRRTNRYAIYLDNVVRFGTSKWIESEAALEWVVLLIGVGAHHSMEWFILLILIMYYFNNLRGNNLISEISEKDFIYNFNFVSPILSLKKDFVSNRFFF